MIIANISAGKKSRNRRPKRVGRGESSGVGKTSGRGHKGAGQRAGRPHHPRHEAGRIPYYRSIPKRGFSNARYRVEYQVVNVGLLNELFDANAVVDPAVLADGGLVQARRGPVKVLADGEVTKAMTIKAHKFSQAARDKIKGAGGSVEVIKS
jgi:large subunit ribosomal protein L15